MNVAIWGATGATGSELLRQCLDDDRIERVRIFVRAPVPMLDARVRQIVVSDFSDGGSYNGQLEGVDVAFWCLGVAQSAVSDPAKYKEITVHYLRLAKTNLLFQSPGSQFHFVSAKGVNRFWSKFVMWANMKLMAEAMIAETLQSDGDSSPDFSRVVIWRPGYILVPGGRQNPTRWESRWQKLEPLFRLVPGLVNPAPNIARAMLRDAIQGATERAVESADIRTSRDINRLAAEG